MGDAVCKYILPGSDTCEVEMPQAAQILSVAFQGDDLCIWALVDSRQSSKRGFYVRGTGHPANAMRDKRFVGTAFHPAGLVFHVWSEF